MPRISNRDSYKKYGLKVCRKCKLAKSLNNFSFFEKNNRMRYNCFCESCDPIQNKRCCACGVWRNLLHFQYNQRNLKKNSKCKNCLPYVANEDTKLRVKKYSQRPENKIKHNKRQLERTRRLLKTSIQFKLMVNLRQRISHALRRQNKRKKFSVSKNLGCSVEFFKKHLESKFKPGMSWDNYGRGPKDWNIDHIIPLSRVDLTNKEEYQKVAHYSNLQPLWHIDNIKKSNKM